MGLTPGLVPPRVDASVKAACSTWSSTPSPSGGGRCVERRPPSASTTCGCCAGRPRAALDRLDDAKPGPGEALHALLDWERDAIVKVAEEWGEIDRSHRKLAHRGSRLGVVRELDEEASPEPTRRPVPTVRHGRLVYKSVRR